LQGESGQIPQEHAILANNGYTCLVGDPSSSGLSPRPPTVPITPSLSSPSTCLAGDPFTCLLGEVVRRSPRLNSKLYLNRGGYKHAWLDGTPR
jgi:hypothetical protein